MLCLLTRLLWAFPLLLIISSRLALAQDSTAVLSETFDDVVFPGLPPGWSHSGEGWATDGGVPSSGSGGNNLVHGGIEPGYAMLPKIDLSRITAGTLTYLVRRTSAYRQDAFVVRASIDGGGTFPIDVILRGAALPAQSGIYARISAALPEALLGASDVVLRFEAFGGESGSANIRIDDVVVFGTMGGIVIAPDRLAFATDSGTTQSRALTVENTLPRSVLVSAPQTSGDAFSIAPSSAARLLPGEVRTYTVTFSPQTSDAFSGAVVLQHDLGSSTVPLSGTASTNTFGFSEATASAVEGAVRIPLKLHYENVTGLHGLEFTLAWDTDAVQFVGIDRGNALSSSKDWMVSYESHVQSARVMLLSNGAEGIPAGMHDPLLTLRFSGMLPQGTDEVPVTLTLRDVAGSLATATGDDAVITTSLGMQVLTLRERRVVFSISPSTVDLGRVEAGETATARVMVSNESGTDTLHVANVASSSTLFNATPSSFWVGPGGQREVTVTFTPTMVRYGQQTARLVISHDGEGGSAEVHVRGLGEGGRGDGHRDGMVEAMDLVHLVDFILRRSNPTASQTRTLDLFPFPSGDAQLSVHDATILSQAIVNGRWPDGEPLPAEIASESLVAGKMSDETGEVALRMVLADGGTRLYVRHAIPIRALQLNLDPGDAAPVEPLPVQGASLMLKQDAGSGRLRLLLYSSGREPIAPGEYALAVLPASLAPSAQKVVYATAIDTSRMRLPVDVSGLARIDTLDSTDTPSLLTLEAPYPNPYLVSSGGRLRIPVALPEPVRVRLDIFDVLGRHVAELYHAEREEGTFVATWDGRAANGVPVPAGLYVLRLDVGYGTRTRTVVVVR